MEDLPEYTAENPKSWFIKVDFKFSKQEKINEEKKYDSVLEKVVESAYFLPEYIRTEVLYLINTKFQTGSYEKLKKVLLSEPPHQPPLEVNATKVDSSIFNIATKCDDANDAFFTKQFEDLKLYYPEQTIIRRRSLVLHDELLRVPSHSFSDQSNQEPGNIEKDPIKLEPVLFLKQLEIDRLCNYDLEEVPTTSPQSKMHLYLGKGKMQKVTDFRFFVRAIVSHSGLTTEEATSEFINNEGKGILLEALNKLEEVLETHPLAHKAYYNHIFLNMIDTMTMDPLKIAENVRNIVLHIGYRFWELRVLQAEICMNVCLPSSTKPIPLRLQLANESSNYLKMHLYKEVLDPVSGTTKFEAWQEKEKPGPLHGLPINVARPPYRSQIEYQQLKLFHAKLNGTTYIYDFPEMFQKALITLWEKYLVSRADLQMPEQVMQCTELVFDPTSPSRLVKTIRPPGENDCGMVAWRVTLFTPEYPQGRDIIVIGNDITYDMGVFGHKEIVLFQKASEQAREMGVPRIYLSTNSSTRVGLAKKVNEHFQIAWHDDANPTKGFEYFYLTPEDYKKTADFVRCKVEVKDGETRYKITNIVGATEGLDVENLKYGNMIGENLQAYNEIVTITMVNCRAMGVDSISAAGQRVIQIDNSNIPLTSNRVDDKLLEGKVYTSNEQLSGLQTGISHARVKDDLEGVSTILGWLSYVPKCRHSNLPILKSLDPIERQVSFSPTSSPYDPRWMLAGRENAQNGIWEEGFFDHGSWSEIMSDWAKTVLTGRARLGGIPVGVIAVETREVELNIPADPENLNSKAKVLSQTGHLWFPDLSFKTAQAIKDFNREDLPLIIFASWPGLSNDAMDMHEQVLKFGVYIVDAFHEFSQAIIVYLPPFSEIRGSSLGVLEAAINLKTMEVYADPNFRGDVLKPEDIDDICFDSEDLIKTMHRCDAECKRLLKILSKDLTSPEEQNQVESELKERETYLMPLYRKIALNWADVHDTPVGMYERTYISKFVPWQTSRTFFYWLLKRRLFEKQVKNEIAKIIPNKTDAEASSMIKGWFEEHHGQQNEHFLEKDKLVAEWLEKLIKSESLIELIRSSKSTQ